MHPQRCPAGAKASLSSFYFSKFKQLKRPWFEAWSFKQAGVKFYHHPNEFFSCRVSGGRSQTWLTSQLKRFQWKTKNLYQATPFMIQQRWHKRDEKTREITLSGPRQGAWILQWGCWIFQEKVGFNKHYRKKLHTNWRYCQIVKFVQIKCVLCGVKRVWLACMELLGIRSLLCCIFLELQATAYQSIGAEGNTLEIPATNSLLLALRRPWKGSFHFSFGALLEQQKDREQARISAPMSKCQKGDLKSRR